MTTALALVAIGASATPPELPADRNMWRYAVIHHSASPSGNAASFDRMHRGKGWDGLAYHFVITNGKGGVDGGLEVGRRWWEQKHGAHAGALAGGEGEARNDFNEFGIGICLVGNFEKSTPTQAQMKTLAKLLTRLREEYGIEERDILGHRHVKSTACPGKQFPWKTLFSMSGMGQPHHLYKRSQIATRERCPWCWTGGAVAKAPHPFAPQTASVAAPAAAAEAPADLPGTPAAEEPSVVPAAPTMASPGPASRPEGNGG
ncbi:MAG: peptidoglycan recognition family protein [Armatimonadota bacterium]